LGQPVIFAIAKITLGAWLVIGIVPFLAVHLHDVFAHG